MQPVGASCFHFSPTLLTRNVISVVGTTLVALEYLNHIEAERRYLRFSRWSLAKFLYLSSRILPFGVVAVWLYHSFPPDSTTPEACLAIRDAIFMITTVTCLCGDAILYVRIYALSMHSRKMKVFLVANFTSVALAHTLTVGLFLRERGTLPTAKLSGSTFCFSKAGQFWSVIVYSLHSYSAALTMALSLWYGLRLFRSLKPVPSGLSLLKIFYLDGIFYFVVIEAMSLANIISSLHTPVQYRTLLPIPQVILHSILAMRMVLHLREVSRIDMPNSCESEVFVRDRDPCEGPPALSTLRFNGSLAQIED